ncbi:MAG TPA: gephyrin-like molybdotransferase Glp [Gammaproteobacteria bacterium]|nr:gephyrin-like molybdotransferase Glp [Gammaproteobacteria bacterium]
MSATDPCFDGRGDMLSVDQAIDRLLAQAAVISESEAVDLAAAAGRVLAEDLASPIDVPGFDNSAMDGYALHSRDIETARDAGLPVTLRITAGSAGARLQPGSAARIFTGAPLPAGADTVVMQERCRVADDRVWLESAATTGENIRPRGNDIAAGGVVLARGTLLQAAHLGQASSVGIARVEVRRRLRVAVFSTGDELVEPGRPLAPGQIYNSNRYQLNALLAAQGCEVIDLGSIADDLDTTRNTLLQAASQADLVMTTGGVSVGEEDHVKAALQAVGTLHLWRIRMKPGKPLAFGRIGDTPFIGLPGNPVSVFVTFLLFARPYLKRMQGRTDAGPRRYPVRAGFDYRAKQRREYVRVRLHADADGTPVAEAFPRQGSDVLSSVVWADGLAELAEGVSLQAGDTVSFLPFAEWTR